MLTNKIYLYATITVLSVSALYLVIEIIMLTINGEVNISFYLETIYYFMEVVSVILIVFFIIYQVSVLHKTNKKLYKTTNTLKALQGEMANFIDKKFELWHLTKAEQEVAWFIIKGFSIKDISQSRNTNEKTINNQLNSIYRKSNNKNKYEFLSSFLEEFMNL